jgi:hypothetical protein
LSSLAAIFGRSSEKPQDSEKLLNLYWNRAELKKEFARMRKEQFKLQDRIKQQEGTTARIQQKLDHLEGLLLDPDWAANVIVFYQLRSLALRCERKLAKLAEQLKQQREQRQHNSLLVKWNEERARESKACEQEFAAERQRASELDERLRAERSRLMAMSGFLRFFRKRSVTAVLDGIAAEIVRTEQRQDELLGALEEIRNRRPPENRGLELSSKRSINFMILAFAQQLFLHFRDNDLAGLAKEANEKSAGAVNYGDRQSCEDLLGRVRKRLEALEGNVESAAVLQRRAKLIGEHALFRTESDAVPISATVTTVYDIDDDGGVRKFEANLLGENYWGIAKVLSR